jgi:antitoxin component YwqK of YwqJK toxin-antitoxin module
MKVSLISLLVIIAFSSFGQNQVDSQGRRQGEWYKLHEGTKVYQYKGQFKDDKPVGKFSYFYKSSKVKAIIKHEENSNRSEAYYYHENGAFMSYGIFRNQLKDSIWVIFGPSQRISSTETYVNGVLHGIKRVYYVPEDINDKSQIPSAVFNYVNGVLEGDYVEYFETLVVKVKGQYANNKKVGIWERYHPNGKKMTLTRYKNGWIHGWCMAYDETGKETGKVYYYHGELYEGKRLKVLMEQMKKAGVNPNN